MQRPMQLQLVVRPSTIYKVQHQQQQQRQRQRRWRWHADGGRWWACGGRASGRRCISAMKGAALRCEGRSHRRSGGGRCNRLSACRLASSVGRSVGRCAFVSQRTRNAKRCRCGDELFADGAWLVAALSARPARLARYAVSSVDRSVDRSLVRTAAAAAAVIQSIAGRQPATGVV